MSKTIFRRSNPTLGIQGTKFLETHANAFNNPKISSIDADGNIDAGWEDPRAHGDGSRTGANISAACALASTAGGKVRIAGGNYVVTVPNLDFKNVPLDFMPGCVITIAPGCTPVNVCIHGSPSWQIFDCALDDVPSIISNGYLTSIIFGQNAQSKFLKAIGSNGTFYKDIGSNKVLINHILGGSLEPMCSGKITLPTAFKSVWTPDFNIIKLPRGKYTASIDWESKKPSMSGKNSYYVSPDGLDTNDGLSRDTPLQTISAAYSKSDVGRIVLMDGYHYLDSQGIYTDTRLRMAKDLIIEADSGACPIVTNERKYNWKEYGSGVYYAVYNKDSETNFGIGETQYDRSHLDSDGVGLLMIHVDSLAECIATENTYYYTNSTIYYHLIGGAQPEHGNGPFLGTVPVLDINGAAKKYWIKGVKFWGGARGTVQLGYDSAPSLYMIDCELSYCQKYTDHPTRSPGGLRVIDSTGVYLLRCKALKNWKDGFNYHASNFNTYPFLEQDCIALQNGNEESDQGSTAHDGVYGIRINGKYLRNFWQGIADVGGKTLHYNCVSGDCTSQDGFAYEALTDHEMWLYECSSIRQKSSARSAGSTSILNLYDCLFDSPITDGNGTVNVLKATQFGSSPDYFENKRSIIQAGIKTLKSFGISDAAPKSHLYNSGYTHFLINNPTISKNPLGWGLNYYNNSSVSENVTYDSDEDALKIFADYAVAAHRSCRSQSFSVHPDKIYRVSLALRKDIATGTWGVAVSGYTQNAPRDGNEIVSSNNNLQGTVNVIPISTNRVEGTPALDVRVVTDIAASITYVQYVFYILGANVSVDRMPVHTVGNCIKMSSNANACAIVLRNQDNTETASLYAKDIEVSEYEASSIHFKNIGDWSTLPNYANDSLAAAGGIPIGALYRNGSIIMVRIS